MNEKILVPLILLISSHTVIAEAVNRIIADHNQQDVSPISTKVENEVILKLRNQPWQRLAGNNQNQ